MIDPYASNGQQILRLLSEYNKHGSLIVAVDFDDTVFDFHSKGHQYTGVIETLKRCQRQGFHIVLFTGSAKERWEEQIQYLAHQGITIHSVNKNPIPLPFGNDGKIYFNILLDDRAGLGQALEVLNFLLTVIEESPNEDFSTPRD